MQDAGYGIKDTEPGRNWQVSRLNWRRSPDLC